MEEAIDDVWVINARHMRNVPGRKNLADACWGAQLLERGLVRPSFIPPRPTREQCDLTRYRKLVIEERGRDPAASQGSGGRRGQTVVGGVVGC